LLAEGVLYMVIYGDGPRTRKYMYMFSCKSWHSEVLPGRLHIVTSHGWFARRMMMHEFDVYPFGGILILRQVQQ